MKVIWGANGVEDFVMHYADLPRGFGECVTALVVDSQDQVAAGVVFHNWNPEAEVLEASAAAVNPKWATRSVLAELMGYAFSHCQMIVARTAADNMRVCKLWKAMGASEYIIPRMRGRTASEAILCVTDDAWRKSRLSR